MVKCPIVPLSATTNGPSPLFSPPSSHPSLFCLIPPPTCLTVIIFLHRPSRHPFSSSCTSACLIPLSSVNHLSPPVYSSPPSINFFLLPHLLSFPIQFFPTLPAFLCVPTHTFTFPRVPFFSPNVSFSCLSVSQALAVRYSLLQSVSFPHSMSSSRLGDMLTFSTLSQVLHHICSLMSVMQSARLAPPCSHKVVMHHWLAGNELLLPMMS